MSKIDLHTHHPILDIQDHVVFASNGNVVLCFEVVLPEIYSLSEKDFEELHGIWFQAFKALPTGTVIHRQDNYQRAQFSGEALSKDTFLAKATHDYFKGRGYLVHRSHLFFVLPLDKTLNASKYVNPFRRMEKAYHRKLDVQVAEFMTAAHDAVTYINNSKRLGLTPMRAKDILEHTHDYFNGFNPDVATDMLLDSKGIEIGDHYFDVLAVNSELCFSGEVQSSIPNKGFASDEFVFHQGFLDGLGLDLKDNHIVNHILYLEDNTKWRKFLDKKIEELSKSSNFGTQNKVVLKKIQQIVDEINGDDSSRLVRGHLNVVFWHPEKEGLKRMASKIKASFKELDIRPYAPMGKNGSITF